MPTYEYACTSCGHEWEAEQSIKDAPLTECDACHKPTARRQISRGVGFILKGSGWYSDLYASSSNKKPETSEADKGGDKSTSDKGGSDKGSSGSSTPDTSSGGSTSSGSTSSGGSAGKASTSGGSTAAA